MGSARDGTASLWGMPLTQGITATSAAGIVNRLASGASCSLVVTPNADHFVRWQRDHRFREAYSQASLHLADGAAIVWMARAIGLNCPERVTGVDLLELACARAGRDGGTLHIIGGTAGRARRAGLSLVASAPGLRLGVCVEPSAEQVQSAAWIRSIATQIDAYDAASDRHTPRLIAVCLGSPKQEYLYERLSGKVSYGAFLGVGAAVDFHSGAIKRAPEWIGRIGLEWLFRLFREPKRMGPRYARDIAQLAPFAWRSVAVLVRGFVTKQSRRIQ